MTTYKKLSDKPYHSEYLIHDTRLNHPVAVVWPHVVNIGGWMSAHRLETIDGAAGQVGHFERVYPRNLAATSPAPHYHLYGVAALVPLKMVALEVFPEAGGSYGNPANKTSFDSIILTDLGDQTHLTFHMVDVLLDRPASGAKLHSETPEARLVRLRGVLDGYFDNLRNLIVRGG